MKKYKYFNYIILISLFITTVSCNKRFLDVVPTSQLSAETIFGDKSGGDLFLYDVYNGLPDAESMPGYNYDSFESWADNAVCRFSWSMSWQNGIARSYGANTYTGLYNHDYPAIPFLYDKIFVRIRKCNVFIKNVTEKAANFPDTWRIPRLAEARFLRAYYYHQAWMAYGGLPIITEPLDRLTQGDSIFQPRATFDETFKFITNELQSCANDLPNEVGSGRATKGAALTLKGWCELFAGHYDLAAATNKQVIDLGVYNLFPDYNQQFFAENNNNNESIFAYQHIPGTKPSGRSALFGPSGDYNSLGCMEPTQNLIDDYRMSNGLPITDPNSGYDPNQPYLNREPRFYQSIIYAGSVFAGKTYSIGDLFNPGLQNQTGYSRRKGIGEQLHVNPWGASQEGSNFVYFRFAEVLLNYAEAKLELNQIDASVIGAIDQLRLRGGIPSLEDTYLRSTFSQSEMRTIIRNERRIELAFEVKRYWDLIRWRTAEVILNQPVYGINIENGMYVKILVHSMFFTAPKNYLFPIYQPWIDSNPVMKKETNAEMTNGQNPGY